MKATGLFFEELPVISDRGVRHTNPICEKLGEEAYAIDGKKIEFPVRVRESRMLMNAFLVDAGIARQMLAGIGVQVVELWPGKAILQLIGVDYRENDLGDYNEGAINFVVTAPGEPKPFPFLGAMAGVARGTLSNFVYRMPVDQEFTTHAGRFIWGFPKWVTRIDIDFDQERAHCSVIDEGELVYSIHAKTGGSAEQKESLSASIAVRGRQAWKTLGTRSGKGVTFRLGGTEPTIGESHPLSTQLRLLGLPKRPLFSVSVARLEMSFGTPEGVDIGNPFRT